MTPPLLNSHYWDDRYRDGKTGWDIGQVSTPLASYIDQLTDKNLSILIPGCGNAYEADYLLQKGFRRVTVIDISPVAAEAAQNKLAGYGERINVIAGDFFKLQQKFDLILEQTFFCALDPTLRVKYAEKMYDLLKQNGKLVGLLFDRPFDGGPPFGGSREEYAGLFAPLFDLLILEPAYNSIEPRKNTELFFIASRNK